MILNLNPILTTTDDCHCNYINAYQNLNGCHINVITAHESILLDLIDNMEDKTEQRAVIEKLISGKKVKIKT